MQLPCGFYQWSHKLVDRYAGEGVNGPPGGPTVEIQANTFGTTTTVEAEASEVTERVFLRCGVSQN